MASDMMWHDGHLQEQRGGRDLSLQAVVTSEAEGFLRVGLSGGRGPARLALGGSLGSAHTRG